MIVKWAVAIILSNYAGGKYLRVALSLIFLICYVPPV